VKVQLGFRQVGDKRPHVAGFHAFIPPRSIDIIPGSLGTIGRQWDEPAAKLLDQVKAIELWEYGNSAFHCSEKLYRVYM